MFDNQMKSRKRFRLADWIRRLLLAWLTAITVEYFLLPAQLRDLSGLDGLARMAFPRIVVLGIVMTVALWCLSHFWRAENWERWLILAVFSILSLGCLWISATWPFLVWCLLCFLILTMYAVAGWNGRPEAYPKQNVVCGAYYWITAAISILFFLYVGLWTVSRVYSFSTPTYDFGIFSQMFYYMKHTGLPMTTLERDGLLSHFAVHVSPIYYLLLPFYSLAPRPETLQILQAAIKTSAVVPIWLIGKCCVMSGLQRLLICVVMLLFPAFAGGTSYDIHENCFLMPLVLWLFFGISRKNAAVTATAAILTLTVKEDAAVYVAIIGLWLIVKTVLRTQKLDVWNLITGIAMTAISVAWFIAVTRYLAKTGDGVMTYRYNNFMYDGSSSLIAVIKSVILNPMKAVYECADSEKTFFTVITLLPLLGMPLLTRRYERYILLIPYVLVNLMSDYAYQHDIFFQYAFGSIACLLYLTVVNLADRKLAWQRTAVLATMAFACAVCFAITVVPKANASIRQSVQYRGYYESIRESLSTIPENADVAATTFYTTQLSQREILYDVRYCSKAHLLSSEYVVLSLNSEQEYSRYASPGKGDGFMRLTELLVSEGYAVYHTLDGVLVIYRKE